MFDTPHYISIKTAYTEYFWRIIKLEHPPFDDTIPGDLVGFIHFSPFFSSSPSPSCCSVQGDQRVLDRLEQRQLHIQQGTPQKKKGSIKQALMMVIRWLYDVDTISDVYMMF